ncbi:hypothetical protein BASA50_009158 [Batrachochytrium salamandrivorans]|uniref:VWFD domain-containing protein n=1 Tax=Batrachochytrium salamandrivorans TaxID=1357716 RepID=A0ABQ8F247_9FUNG|nr:hypothetical protein BASA62_009632 [Batrachochytrium salamandrivorans]KAH6576119.1 hypothetical protein BASA60_004674 [Batrachochytrium salamandrivorans]KAH6590780.1 hypothetical protein BASA50_009158 [Batrachochytrium salamandrivorans]KAH6602906.1 hypothetical protein BASA61_000643 [Batrachochytrium salamandrivorans]KAJ1345031.1 hypothetical protein BSLG_000546 [Batrachochytrium salamandrivorans]
MLSRLIITFLCAAAIGSVSGTFLTFDPAEIEFEDVEAPVSFSAKLNSKPTEDVIVYLQHPSMSMSGCVIVFNSDNWDVPRQLTGVPAPLVLGSSNPPGKLDVNSKLLARAMTADPRPAELSTTDTLKVTQKDMPQYTCSAGEDIVSTLDSLKFLFNRPGWYTLLSTGDVEIQVLMGRCAGKLPCFTAVLARYGSSVMGMDASGPVKDIDDYFVTEVTQNTNGVLYTSNPSDGEHIVTFPYGSRLHVKVVSHDGGVKLDMDLTLAAGYPSPGGLCNRPRSESPDNKLMGRDGNSYDPADRDEVDDFTNSWGVEDEDVLTNPDARTLHLPVQHPGTVCTFPVNP